ncbi:MAG: DegT/DnrJ/EryC1/StrS family aminotransferase [Myxococcota bacterium]
MRRVPFLDLAARHAEAAAAVEARVLDVLRSGRWIGGPVVAEAEALAAAQLGRAAAVGVASGTDALMLALQALDVGPGDEVVVPALTFFATAGAVRAVGAEVVVADVGEDALLDEASAAAVCGPRTRAVIPVHLFGSVAARPALDVPVLDDAAQAVGAEPAPGVGALTALSAYPTKTWGAAGDGGFVAGDDPALLERVRALANHGAVEAHLHHPVGRHVGRASRLDAVGAAVLVGHHAVLAERVARRRALAARYDAGLPAPLRPLARTAGSAVQQYCVRVPAPARDAVRAGLAERGVETAVYYPRPLQRQPALAGCRAAPTPVADALCAELLALPIHDCGADAVDVVLDALHAAVTAC